MDDRSLLQRIKNFREVVEAIGREVAEDLGDVGRRFCAGEGVEGVMIGEGRFGAGREVKNVVRRAI